MAKHHNNQAGMLFRFPVSTGFAEGESAYPADEQAVKLLAETYTDINLGKADLEQRLLGYIESYPHIPRFKNRLATYYLLNGKHKQAAQVQQDILTQHPDYLFGKLWGAQELYNAGNYASIPQWLGEELELDSLYPNRKVFEVGEVIGYYKMVALYQQAIGNVDEAWELVDKLNQLAPDHPELKSLENILVRQQLDRFQEPILRKAAQQLKNSKKTTPNIHTPETMPAFENKLVLQLYQHDFRIPNAMLQDILALPDDSLARDLKKILADSLDRYPVLCKAGRLRDKQVSFLTHAIFLIAEKGRVELLPDILNVLKLDGDLTEFYMGDALIELGWIALYKLCIGDPAPLFDFLTVPDIDFSSGVAATRALQHLYCHQPALRPAIIEGFKALTAYYIGIGTDNPVNDTELISELACTMAQVGAAELGNQIQSLYQHDLVHEGYAGTCESLLKDSSNHTRAAESIPTILEMYHEVITTWAGYKDPDLDSKWESADDDADNVPIEPTEAFDSSLYAHKFSNELQTPFVRLEDKVGRNDPCPCGSGKKYKKCCLDSSAH